MSTSRTGRTDILAGRPHWLVELTLGGSVYRLADEPVDVTSQAGTTYHYAGGLSAISQEYSLDAGSPQSISLTLIGTGIDWASLVQEGQDLTAMTAVIRRWFEGQKLDAARIITNAGHVDSPEYGTIDEPFVLSVQNFPWTDTGLVPSATQVVSDLTWPVRSNQAVDDQIAGQCYPIVVGRPGLYRSATNTRWTGGTAWTPCVPALLVEGGGIVKNDAGVYIGGAVDRSQSRWLIAGHAVKATTCLLYDLSAGGDATGGGVYPIVTGTDLLGQQVSYIQADGVTGSTWMWPIAGHEYRVAWTDYGAYNADRTGGLNGAGEVIYWLLTTYSTVPLNRGLMQSQRAFLDAYKLDFYIVSAVSPYDWIVSNVVPLLPIGWVETGTGGYFVTWRFGAVAFDRVAHIDADAGAGQVVRMSGVTYTSRSDVCNAFTLQYAYDQRQGNYQRTTVLDDSSADSDEGESYLCRISIARYGRIERKLSTPLVYDEATARLILRALARRYAVQRRMVTYAVPQELEALLVGDVVTLTDSALYLSSQVALVWSIALGDNGVGLTLLLLDNPDQLSRRVV